MPTMDESPTRRRCRAGRDRVEDRVRPQLQEDACVSVAGCVDVREVIERRRDADGVGEKSRRAGDAEEEQIVSRIVTGRSHHEIIRLGGQRAKPCVSSTMLNS